VSNGIPTTAKSISSVVFTFGNLIKVLIPEKRGALPALGGAYFILLLNFVDLLSFYNACILPRHSASANKSFGIHVDTNGSKQNMHLAINGKSKSYAGVRIPSFQRFCGTQNPNIFICEYIGVLDT